MVSERNRRTAEELRKKISSSGIVGVINIHKLPAKNLFEIKNKLRPGATVTVVKKRVLQHVLNHSERKDMPRLSEFIAGSPALLLSEGNPFTLARRISESKAPAPAKPGDIAPRDIIVKAGPTRLPAGPAIGDLQKARIPAIVQDGKIAVKQDTVVAKQGDEISQQIADVLGKLGIHPMEIGLDIRALWEGSTVYTKDVLLVPQEKYINDLKSAHIRAFQLSVGIGYCTPENIRTFLSRARTHACSLSVAAGIITRDTVIPLISRACSRMHALRSKLDVKQIAETREGDRTEPDHASEEGETKENTAEKDKKENNKKEG